MANYPVSLQEFKANMRLPECDGSLNEPLQNALDAASEYCREFTGIDFEEDFKENNSFPPLLRYAILMVAGDLFKSPTDRPYQLPTQAQHLLKMFQRSPFEIMQECRSKR
ncbi:Phage gp6-like head-tail connector protein [Bacteroidales bacterium Barb7]|nr:Phage gp6-like head-tail connector protein [Bacteroidales bacterium Barb7]